MRATQSTELEIPIQIIEGANSVAREMEQEFDDLIRTDPARARSFSFGFANGKGELSEDPRHRHHANAPFKYVRFPKQHTEKNLRYVEFIRSLSTETDPLRPYEIGVGPGYVMYMLRESLSVPVHGCDIRIQEEEVYKRIRFKLGLSDYVAEQRITYHIPIVVPANTNLIYAFWTVFNKGWSVVENEWFVKECSRVTRGTSKRLVMRFNAEGYLDKPEVIDFYRSVGRFPFDDDSTFCVIDL